MPDIIVGCNCCQHQWYDFRLRWIPEDFENATHMDFAGDPIWKPDIGLMNGKLSASFDFSAGSNSRLNVEFTGLITWLYGVILDVACPLDFTQFPFDTQTCYLIISPWQSSTRQITLQPMQHGPTVDNNYLPNSNVSEWQIQSIGFSLENYKSQMNISYQYIKVAVSLKRQPLYFTIMVLIPFSMLSCLACLIFTLEKTGDRLSVALSLILSMTMYVVIVSSNAPRSMRTVPLMGIFLLNQLGFLFAATVLAVLNNRLIRCVINLDNAHENCSKRKHVPVATVLKRSWSSQREQKHNANERAIYEKVGKGAYCLLKNLSYPDSLMDLTYEHIKKTLLGHVTPVNFEVAQRAKFNIMQRQSTQSVRDFILQIHLRQHGVVLVIS
ncbi:nicotinic acetylcholine receptor alpha-6 [Paragonimus westermani]|uniref:Nicotinic acetylcholine receptor alpha-6 n=1 Tax=Paragonimus westermani TaxID=34504 RepID=A0A5J4NMK8_9TREM|nr:nicotinic acetylcholine receptor alpha-6 [Paragonimus westermani]